MDSQNAKCLYCGAIFKPRRSHGRYCCPKHKMADYDRKHPRQKIGVNTVGIIEADGTIRLPAGMRIKLIALPPKGASNG